MFFVSPTGLLIQSAIACAKVRVIVVFFMVVTFLSKIKCQWVKAGAFFLP